MERVAGVEPAYSAWKADVIAVIPHPHIKRYFFYELKIPNNRRGQELKGEQGVNSLMVPGKGFEPSRANAQGIFLLLYVTIATLLCCSLEYVLTMLINNKFRLLVYTLYTFMRISFAIQHGVFCSRSPFQPASTLRVSSQALSTISRSPS